MSTDTLSSLATLVGPWTPDPAEASLSVTPEEATMAVARLSPRPSASVDRGLRLLDMPVRALQPNGGPPSDNMETDTPGHRDVLQHVVAVVGGTSEAGDGGGEPKGHAAAAKTQLEPAEWGTAVAVALAAIVVGVTVGVAALPDAGTTSYRVGSDFSAFAALFVLSLAVERLLEPLARWSGTAAAKDARDQAEATAANGDPSEELASKLAEAQAAYSKARQRAAIGHWGLAVGISAAAVGTLNVLLLTAISATDSASPNRVVDLLVTAFVVGAGTKPLHDLVTKLEKKKEQEQDPASVGGAG